MDFQSKRRLFLVLFILVIAGQTSYATTDNIDADRDALVQFNDQLSGLAKSIGEVESSLTDGISEAETDVTNIVDSESRMNFEVRVMRLEQDAEVLSGKRTANSAEKELGISQAETELSDTLAPKLLEMAQNLTELNASLHQTTLRDDDLVRLQAQVNANLTEEEQIVIPTASEMMSNVTAEIDKVTPIFQNRATPEQLQIINSLLQSIREKFQSALTDDSNDLQESARISREIDASLAQIRQLNVLDAQARMEL